MISFLTPRYLIRIEVTHAAHVINDVQVAGGSQYKKNIYSTAIDSSV